MPKSQQKRCRDSLNTKLNVHSPIPTSFSHVTATASGHYLILFVGSNVSTCHTRCISDVITHEHLFCMYLLLLGVACIKLYLCYMMKYACVTLLCMKVCLLSYSLGVYQNYKLPLTSTSGCIFLEYTLMP